MFARVDGPPGWVAHPVSPSDSGIRSDSLVRLMNVSHPASHNFQIGDRRKFYTALWRSRHGPVTIFVDFLYFTCQLLRQLFAQGHVNQRITVAGGRGSSVPRTSYQQTCRSDHNVPPARKWSVPLPDSGFPLYTLW